MPGFRLRICTWDARAAGVVQAESVCTQPIERMDIAGVFGHEGQTVASITNRMTLDA